MSAAETSAEVSAEADLRDTLVGLRLTQHDEEASAVIVGLATSAVHDLKPNHTLRDIYEAAVNSGCSSLLDPLNLIPLILPSRDPAADELLALCGECCSAKEVLIACSEAAEHLHLKIDAEEEEEDDRWLGHIGQVNRLNLMSCSMIPRLKLRKATAFDTIRPLLGQLRAVSVSVGRSESTPDEARDAVGFISRLHVAVVTWVRANARDTSETSHCVDYLRAWLIATVETFGDYIRASLAQRTFERCYPRLVMRSAVQTGEWDAATSSMNFAWDACQALEITTKTFRSQPTLGALVLLAHAPSSFPSPKADILEPFFPTVLMSLQTNKALDASLALLLTILTPSDPDPALSPELIAPLTHTLALLSSVHPDPPTRHIAFRLLARVLALAPPPPRLALLRDLLSGTDADGTPPQLRIATVGLVRESVLSAFAPKAQAGNVFASPLLLQTLGPLFLRTDPPDLLAHPRDVDLEKFMESPEPRRLTECLTLYYLLLLNDKQNKTGVRDKGTIASVERTFLAPVRTALAHWSNAGNTRDDRSRWTRSGTAKNRWCYPDHCRHLKDRRPTQTGQCLWATKPVTTNPV